MKKKFLALVLTLAMVLSLAPVGALATDGEESQKPADVIYDNTAYKGNATVDGVDSLNKTAVKAEGENTYKVTLEVKMHETTSTISQAAATVLVIDVSGSMNNPTCGKEEHTHTDRCYTTHKKCTREDNPGHWTDWGHKRSGTGCTHIPFEGWFYQIDPILSCTKEVHTHTSSCYPIDAAKKAAKSFVDTYAGNGESAGRYLSIVVFGTDAYVKLDWIDVSTVNGKASATSAIDEISANGGTNLEQGLAKAKDQFTDQTVASVNFKNVVALTDGAPTFYGEGGWFGPSGNGSSGSEEINNETAKTAEELKEVASLYTVCFGAENMETYRGGPTVGDFLRDNIATDSNHAYDADNAGALNSVFEKISETITSGISAGVVHDALPTGVSSAAFGENTEADWNLSEEGGFTCNKTTNAETGRTDYTYTKTYTVTIDPDKINSTVLEENNGYYPLNEPTTLTVEVKEGDKQVLNFPIPWAYVKRTDCPYTVKFYKDSVSEDNYISDADTNGSAAFGTTLSALNVNTTIAAAKCPDGYNAAGVIDEENSLTTITTGENIVKVVLSKRTDCPYTVKFYKDSVSEDNYISDADTNGSAAFGTTLSALNVNTTIAAAKCPDGYNAAGVIDEENSLTTITTGENVVKVVLSKRTDCPYTVKFYKDSVSEDNYISDADTNGSAAFGTTLSALNVNTTIAAAKCPDGYNAAGVIDEENSLTTITTGENVVKVVLSKRTDCPYTVKFYKDSVSEDNYISDADTNGSAAFGTTLSALNVNTTIAAAKCPDGYNAAGVIDEENSLTTITTGENVVKVVLSKRTDCPYTVKFYKDSVSEDNYISDADTNGSAAFGTTLSALNVNTTIAAAKCPDGYNAAGVIDEENSLTTITTGENVVKVVLSKLAEYKITIHYVDDAQTPKEIKADEVITQYDGSQYDVTNKIPNRIKNDYVKESMNGSATGTVNGGDVTITVVYTKDVLVDPTAPETDGPGDNIPDKYQVIVKYVPDTTGRGTVGQLTEEVLTIYKDNEKKEYASEGQVTATGSTATATGSSRNYFSKWTNDAGLATSYTAALGQQTIKNAKGGATYTFTANFGYSGGGSGGSNRPKPPVVEIPDDVPTGLNGKDHYAYVVGYPDGMVYPQKNITRAEVATIFFRLLTDETREANMTKSNSYNDMKDGAWYTCAVSTLSKMGIIKGYEDGSFKPDASISRAEFAAIAARFDPDGDKTPATFSDVSSHWAKDEISIAANHGWIKGYEDGSFKPDQKITRAETMTLVNRVLKRLPETKDDLHKDMKTWPDNQNESAWFYLAVQEATNSHYQKLKKDGTHETWESMRETRDWAALEK